MTAVFTSVRKSAPAGRPQALASAAESGYLASAAESGYLASAAESGDSASAAESGNGAYRLQLGSADFRYLAEVAIRHSGRGFVVDSALHADVVVVDALDDIPRVRRAFPDARVVLWSHRRELELPALEAGAGGFACTLDGAAGLEAVL